MLLDSRTGKRDEAQERGVYQIDNSCVCANEHIRVVIYNVQDACFITSHSQVLVKNYAF